MNHLHYLYMSIISALLGAFVCALHNRWLIPITTFTATDIAQHTYQHSIVKKNVTLWYWFHDAWHTEQREIISSHTTEKDIFYLINTLLDILYAEHVIPKQVHLEHCVISCDQNLILSFDHNILDKQLDTYTALMIIESFLKTLRHHYNEYAYVYFLVAHQPIHHTYLDFTYPWPLCGFIE